MHLKMSSGKWRPFCLGLNKTFTTELPIRLITKFIVCLKYDTPRAPVSNFTGHKYQNNLCKKLYILKYAKQ